MTYNRNANYGGLYFELSDVRVTKKPSTLKTNLGKTFIEKEIPLRNAVDTVLNITGVLNGLSRTVGQSLTTAIANDRTTLIALQDGYKHTYSDGEHSGDFVIVPESLIIDDLADRFPGEPIKFTMTLIQWQ